MTARIDLARLAKLAAEATPGPWTHLRGDPPHAIRFGPMHGMVEIGYVRGHSDAEYLAALDPATVTALVRLGQAALALNDSPIHEFDAQLWDDLTEALAPFRGDA